MKKNLNWATFGVGVIGNELAQAMQSQGRTLYAVGNRTHEKAVSFAEKYGIGKVYDQPEEMFTDPNVDIIYLSTPHNTHYPLLLKALNSGKHVLCEKAITLNSEELAGAVRAAEENHVVLAEAMTIYHMPLYRELKKKVADLGPLRMIQMNFGSYKEYNMKNRFFNPKLAGGALLDIGVYALSFMRLFMSSKPDQILSQVKFAESGVDEQAGILLSNPEGEMATLTISLHAKQAKRGTLIYDRGYVEVMEYPRADRAVIVYTEDGHREEITVGDTKKALSYEILDMEGAVMGDRSRIHTEETEDVMAIMTELRKQWGLVYPEEQ